MLRAITFDLWNTIIQEKEYTQERVKCLSKLLHENNIHKSREEIKEAYKNSHEHVHKIWKEENRRYVSIYERLRYLLKSLSVVLPEDLLKRFSVQNEEMALIDPPLLVDGVEKTLSTLKLKYQIGIISDTGITPRRILRKILDMYNILDFFRCNNIL